MKSRAAIGALWALFLLRATVESAESKLSPEEIAEGKRRAAEWVKAREAKK